MSEKNGVALELSFDALTKLFKEHNVKLRRGQSTIHFPNCCPYAAIAVINGSDYMMFDRQLDEKTFLRLNSIEAGFEGWENEGDYIGVYYRIGQKLYNASRKGA